MNSLLKCLGIDVYNYLESARPAAFAPAGFWGLDTDLRSQVSFNLTGTSGDNWFYSGGNDDRISGGLGNDQFHGGEGTDVIRGEDGNDQLFGDGGTDQIEGGEGLDILIGGTGKDELHGGEGDDILYGGSVTLVDGHSFETDLRASGLGDGVSDMLLGGSGNDIYVPEWLAKSVSGIPASATLDLSQTFLTGLLSAAPNLDYISDSDGNGVINPYNWPNNVPPKVTWREFAESELDPIYRGLYNIQGIGWDFIGHQQGATYSQMLGKIVDGELIVCMIQDRLIMSSPQPTREVQLWFQYKMDAGVPFPQPQALQRGFETVSSLAAAATATATDGNYLGMRFATALNQVVGTAAQETLLGTAASDYVQGLDGNDTIKARGGNDIVDGGDGDDTIRGGIGNDELNGDAGDDQLFGQAGDDVLSGGEGDDAISGGKGADHLDGGNGINTLHYGTSVSGVTIDLAANSAFGGDAEGDLILNFANVTGSQFADDLMGTDAANVLRGLGGNDSLVGKGGDDSLFGGLGSDSLAGGEGNDQLRGEAGSDVLEGGLGADVFVFNLGSGNDSISDFWAGQGRTDRVRFVDGQFVNYADMLTHSVNSAAGVVISINAEDSITMIGVQLSQLRADDFMFAQ